MDLLELKRYNTLNIYNEILNENNTIVSIARRLKLSNLSVSKLTKNLVKRKIIEVTTPVRDKRGRRTFVFHPSHRYYSIFIDKQVDSFCLIGIATNGRVVDRFDFELDYEGKTPQEVFDELVMARIKENPNYKFCMSIYLSGIDIDDIVTDESVIKATREDIIIQAYNDDTKTMLFDFNGNCVLSLYSHIHYPKVSKDALLEAIPIDDYLRFTGELYFETYDALQRIVSSNLEQVI